MRYIVICTLAAVLAWPGALVRAADDKDVVKDIKAKLDATVVGVNDFTVRQESKRTNEGANVVTKVVHRQKGVKYRADIEIVGLPSPRKLLVIFDGKYQWTFDGVDMRSKLAAPGSADGGFWWRGISDDATVTRTEKVGDRECYVIQSRWVRTDPFTTMWVDKENLHLLRTDECPAALVHSIYRGDYRKVRGDWEFAHKWLDQEIDAVVTHQIIVPKPPPVLTEVKSVEVNTGLADSLFDAKAARK